ncbi:MAG: tetratricopeptide repeat protein [Bacteroidales bacterium]
MSNSPKRELLLSLFLILLCQIHVCAQDNESLYKAFIENRPEIWKETLLRAKENNQNPKLYLEYLYGFIGWNIRIENKMEACWGLEEMKTIMSNVPNSDFDKNLYISAIMGYTILLKEGSPLVCGPKAIKAINKSIEENPDSPLACIQKGNVLLQTPTMFGGSKKKALNYFLKAENLLIRQKTTNNNWLYIYLLSTIAEMHFEMNDLETAMKYKNRVQKIAPDMFWLKNIDYK